MRQDSVLLWLFTSYGSKLTVQRTTWAFRAWNLHRTLNNTAQGCADVTIDVVRTLAQATMSLTVSSSPGKGEPARKRILNRKIIYVRSLPCWQKLIRRRRAGIEVRHVIFTCVQALD